MAIVFNTMMNQIESLLKQIKETEKQKGSMSRNFTGTNTPPFCL